jgi:trigger factor
VVTEADVEAALASLAERRATLATASRPARAGDFVTADYELATEGQPPRREEGYTFEVGAGRVLPEMDEAALGLSAGDERRLAVRFPEDHPRPELRGRTGQLTLRVTEVKEKEVPPLDDELARGLGSHETLAELRGAVRKELAAGLARQNRLTLEQAVVDAVLATHPFAVPEGLVLREVTHRIGHARDRMRRQGVDPDRLPWDYARLTTELRPDAERAVRRALLLEAIADREEIAVDEAEVEAEIERLARDAGRAPQAMRSLLDRGGDLVGLRLALRERKTLDFLIQHADVQPAESVAPGATTP